MKPVRSFIFPFLCFCRVSKVIKVKNHAFLGAMRLLRIKAGSNFTKYQLPPGEGMSPGEGIPESPPSLFEFDGALGEGISPGDGISASCLGSGS